MGNPVCSADRILEVAVRNVAEPMTQPKTRLHAGRT